VAVELYYHPNSPPDVAEYGQWCSAKICQTPPRLKVGQALWLDAEGLALISAGFEKPFRLTMNMLDARGQGKSLLVKACGVLPDRPSVFDPFLGFGLDALLLARLGCDLEGTERHPLVWLMFREFAIDLGINVKHECGDGLVKLGDETRDWDVVYLDPMFERRHKRALPSRGLQHLQDLQDLDSELTVDLENCLELAMARANKRVVLKRRLKSPVTRTPTHQIKGHSVRFDVYM
jgi:16S rRNA (guanine1516-N2)-methyltransferase